MNIWIFNHYAQSPRSSGGTRHYDMGKELLSRGHTVSVIASGFHYTHLEHSVTYEDDCKVEDIDGIEFIWLKTQRYSKNNILRMFNIISYYLKARKILPKLDLKKPDLIIGSTVHPFAALVASNFAKKYAVPFVYEIRDLWPQTFIDMGLWKEKSLKSFVFKYLESITVKRANKIITLSPLTQDYLLYVYNYDRKNILLLPNGVNESFLQVREPRETTLVNISYIGGIDKVHGLDFIIELAKELKNEKIVFKMYGDGKEKDRLEALTAKKGLSNLVWYDSVPKIEVPALLVKSDLLLLSTANVLYGSENKLYEYMASARPIIFATTATHNTHLDEVDCGIIIDKNSIKNSAENIKTFITNKSDQFRSIGENGRKYVIKYRTIKILVDKLEVFLNGVV